jgi:hypothetical protein
MEENPDPGWGENPDPEWGKNQDPDPGSGMNIPDNFFRELKIVFRVKNT